MVFYRMRHKCAVPGCNNTDTVTFGKGNHILMGCVHLCRECAKRYGEEWHRQDTENNPPKIRTISNKEAEKNEIKDATPAPVETETVTVEVKTEEEPKAEDTKVESRPKTEAKPNAKKAGTRKKTGK